ncbi:hypothetical protein [Longispora urticae]
MKSRTAWLLHVVQGSVVLAGFVTLVALIKGVDSLEVAKLGGATFAGCVVLGMSMVLFATAPEKD